MDWVQTIATGFATGLGVSCANWFHDRHIRDRLDKLTSIIKKKKK